MALSCFKIDPFRGTWTNFRFDPMVFMEFGIFDSILILVFGMPGNESSNHEEQGGWNEQQVGWSERARRKGAGRAGTGGYERVGGKKLGRKTQGGPHQAVLKSSFKNKVGFS